MPQTHHVRSLDGLQVELQLRSHAVVTDEPADKGGRDEGPTPTELFVGSVAACAAVTARMYAQHKGWPLEAIRIRVRLEEGGGDKPPRLVQEIELDGELDEAQRERIRQIAGRCPVHRLVAGPLEMEETLVAGD